MYNVCMYHCFKMKRYAFFIMFLWGRPAPLDPTLVIYRWNWNLTLTASKLQNVYAIYEISRSKTRHWHSEVWTLGGVNTAVPPQSKLWEDSLSLYPLWFTPLTASLASLLANWLVALSLTFHVNSVKVLLVPQLGASSLFFKNIQLRVKGFK